MSDPKEPGAYRPRWVRRFRPARLSPAARALAADPRHLGYAAALAGAFARSSGLDRDDARSAAYLGLCQAAVTFDPGRGLAFSTLARPRIVGAMRDELRERTHYHRTIPRPPTVLLGDDGDRIEARPEGGSP